MRHEYYKDVEVLDSETIQNVYTDKMQMYIKLFLEEYNIESIDNQQQWDACLMYLHDNIFKPAKPLPDNRKCVIDYRDIEAIEKVCDKYIFYCGVYKRMVSVEGFLTLLGMVRETIYNYANSSDNKLSSAWSLILKRLDSGKQRTLDNKLYDSNNVTGQAILVNKYYGYNLPGVSRERVESRSIQSNSLPSLSQNVIETNNEQ